MANNEVDSAIQRLLKLGVKVTTMWENAKLTNSFAKQSISVDLSDVDAVLIKMAYATDTTDYLTDYIVTPNKKSIMAQFAQASYSNVGYCSRVAELKTGAILFYDSIAKNISSTSGGTANNKYQIPYRIYGIKLLGGYSLKRIFAAFFRFCKGGCRICVA